MEDRRRRRRTSNSDSDFSENDEKNTNLGTPGRKTDNETPSETGDRDEDPESEYESAEDQDSDESTDESTSDEDETEDYTQDEGDVVIEDSGLDYEFPDDQERESGDGQEHPDDENKDALDDDEDRKNPAFIPRKGAFYEHDMREGEDGEGGDSQQTEKTEEKGVEKKALWKDDKKWLHDRFDDLEQRPKTREELIALYGYDIRSRNAPPSAPPRRGRGRGGDRGQHSQQVFGDYVTDNRRSNRRGGQYNDDGDTSDRRGGYDRRRSGRNDYNDRQNEYNERHNEYNERRTDYQHQRRENYQGNDYNGSRNDYGDNSNDYGQRRGGGYNNRRDDYEQRPRGANRERSQRSRGRGSYDNRRNQRSNQDDSEDTRGYKDTQNYQRQRRDSDNQKQWTNRNYKNLKEGNSPPSSDSNPPRFNKSDYPKLPTNVVEPVQGKSFSNDRRAKVGVTRVQENVEEERRPKVGITRVQGEKATDVVKAAASSKPSEKVQYPPHSQGKQVQHVTPQPQSSGSEATPTDSAPPPSTVRPETGVLRPTKRYSSQRQRPVPDATFTEPTSVQHFYPPQSTRPPMVQRTVRPQATVAQSTQGSQMSQTPPAPRIPPPQTMQAYTLPGHVSPANTPPRMVHQMLPTAPPSIPNVSMRNTPPVMVQPASAPEFIAGGVPMAPGAMPGAMVHYTSPSGGNAVPFQMANPIQLPPGFPTPPHGPQVITATAIPMQPMPVAPQPVPPQPEDPMLQPGGTTYYSTPQDTPTGTTYYPQEMAAPPGTIYYAPEFQATTDKSPARRTKAAIPIINPQDMPNRADDEAELLREDPTAPPVSTAPIQQTSAPSPVQPAPIPNPGDEQQTRTANITNPNEEQISNKDDKSNILKEAEEPTSKHAVDSGGDMKPVPALETIQSDMKGLKLETQTVPINDAETNDIKQIAVESTPV
ncbi:unnamed protein product [Owenia fusiformis]|uniref:Protein CASC3 n=1 Tax=Owenia fusiformis TaxID=6347 RepID=A0A8J1UF85_OWEFU|nr:unnamed protein product [Owenia fusiformis]